MSEDAAQELRSEVHRAVEAWFKRHGGDSRLKRVRFDVRVTYYDPGDFADKVIDAGRAELPQQGLLEEQ